jgi:hypothetical protein
MSLRGVECGPARQPVQQLSQARMQELFDRVDDAELLDPVPEIVITQTSAKDLARKS